MFRKITHKFLQISLLALGFSALVLVTARLATALHARARLYGVNQAPQRRVAIVFGAGLSRDGSPTAVLRDRVETAAKLYFDGKVNKLLMSGDNRYVDYNEPGAMRAYALGLGVPDTAIVLDFAGRRTYDTCYRARDIFGVEPGQAILVTQSFHLPRALYVCDALGLDTVGVPSDVRQYRRRTLILWNLRETPATLVALWEVHVAHPYPVLGQPEPIFPKQAQVQ